MRKLAIVLATIFASCGTAEAQTVPMPFSFVPFVYSNDASVQTCRPLGPGWLNYLSNQHNVTSTLPTFLGTQDGKSFFTGPICIQFTPQNPRWPTGHVLMWVWHRRPDNRIFAAAYEVECLQNKMARRFAGNGITVDQVIGSTVRVNDPVATISNNIPGAYAVSVCRLLEMFYPGRPSYPQ